MKKKKSSGNLKPRHLFWFLAFFLVIFLTAGVFLYWRNALTLGELALAILGLVTIGLLFVIGIRVAQRDAFVDGFRDGRDGVKRTKKKS